MDFATYFSTYCYVKLQRCPQILVTDLPIIMETRRYEGKSKEITHELQNDWIYSKWIEARKFIGVW